MKVVIDKLPRSTTVNYDKLVEAIRRDPSVIEIFSDVMERDDANRIVIPEKKIWHACNISHLLANGLYGGHYTQTDPLSKDSLAYHWMKSLKLEETEEDNYGDGYTRFCAVYRLAILLDSRPEAGGPRVVPMDAAVFMVTQPQRPRKCSDGTHNHVWTLEKFIAYKKHGFFYYTEECVACGGWRSFDIAAVKECELE